MKKRLYLLTALLILNIFLWSAVYDNSDSKYLKVTFLDVGQGDAILIESPTGNQVLVDGGPNKKVLEELGKVMRNYDRSIDIVISTHPDADHIGGISDVFNAYEVLAVIDPGIVSETETYKTYIDLIEKEGAQYFIARRGQVIDLDDGVYIKIFFPDRDVSGVDPNAGSVILQVVYGETEFLLTGDAPKSIENYLVSIYGRALQSDILKAGHHGSKTSSSFEFLSYVNPETVVISAGKNNKYGHPHENVLDTIKKIGSEIVGTYDRGGVQFLSNGKEIVRKEI